MTVTPSPQGSDWRVVARIRKEDEEHAISICDDCPPSAVRGDHLDDCVRCGGHAPDPGNLENGLATEPTDSRLAPSHDGLGSSGEREAAHLLALAWNAQTCTSESVDRMERRHGPDTPPIQRSLVSHRYSALSWPIRLGSSRQIPQTTERLRFVGRERLERGFEETRGLQPQRLVRVSACDGCPSESEEDDDAPPDLLAHRSSPLPLADQQLVLVQCAMYQSALVPETFFCVVLRSASTELTNSHGPPLRSD